MKLKKEQEEAQQRVLAEQAQGNTQHEMDQTEVHNEVAEERAKPVFLNKFKGANKSQVQEDDDSTKNTNGDQ